MECWLKRKMKTNQDERGEVRKGSREEEKFFGVEKIAVEFVSWPPGLLPDPDCLAELAKPR